MFRLKSAVSCSYVCLSIIVDDITLAMMLIIVVVCNFGLL